MGRGELSAARVVVDQSVRACACVCGGRFSQKQVTPLHFTASRVLLGEETKRLSFSFARAEYVQPLLVVRDKFLQIHVNSARFDCGDYDKTIELHNTARDEDDEEWTLDSNAPFLLLADYSSDSCTITSSSSRISSTSDAEWIIIIITNSAFVFYNNSTT